MADKPTLFGADYSVYVRIARLALHEKQIAYDLVPVDIFAEGGPPAWYIELQPFGRIPAFRHGRLALFETSAITRYIDEAFDGPALQSTDPVARAVMNQIIGLLDAYAYRTLVWDIYVESVSKPKEGKPSNQAVVSAARPLGELCLATLARLQRGPWLCGDAVSLADLHAAPMFDYFLKAPVAKPMLARHANLQDWWNRMQARSSMTETTPTS